LIPHEKKEAVESDHEEGPRLGKSELFEEGS
jgi:hypothetical protein